MIYNKKLTSTVNSEARVLTRPELSMHHEPVRRVLMFYTGLATLLLLALLMSTSVRAQYNGHERIAVIVFEECDFRGNSRALEVGEYSDVRRIRIGNDKISSIQVNRGYQVRLFQDERFRGISKVFTRDERCLRDGWNDQASSLVVDYDDRGRDDDYGRERDRSPAGDRDRGPGYDRDGDRRPGYGRDREGGNATPAQKPVAKPRSEHGVIHGSCFNYKAVAHGGEAGIKFQAKGIKKKFGDSPVTGRVCHQGPLEMELNKLDKNVEVVVEINGRQYKFRRGEKEHLYLNQWYRKMIQLSVRP